MENVVKISKKGGRPSNGAKGGTSVAMGLRMDKDIYEDVAAAAKANFRSVSQEIAMRCALFKKP